jgi:hypothetical protein
MSRSVDRLYELLPVVHRLRDAQQGYPLRALLRVINEQVNLVEDDIGRLYDNWFIETCEDWVVPYLGDLIAYRPVHEAGEPRDGESVQARARNRTLVPRREMANLLGSRRRKGTLALLELLARDVAGWPARAVELYTLLGWTQHAKFLRPRRARTADLRDGDALDLVDGPFERLAHTVDVRRVVSHRSPGRYNIPSVGVFVWRLKPYSVTQAPAYCLESEGPHCYTFSVLGNDTPLHTRPELESEPTHIAEERNLPGAIRRRALEERVSVRPLRTRASDTYYGAGKSLALYAPDWPTRGARQPVPRELIVPADLSLWRYRAPRGQVAMDPVLGRIVFPAGQLPRGGVWVSYHYAFSADMGGGEYRRALTQPVEHGLYHVRKPKPWEPEPTPDPNTFRTLNEALAKWRADQQALGPEPADPAAKAPWRLAVERLRAAAIEIIDSAVYSEQLAVRLERGESLQIRAARAARPVIRLLDYMTDQPDAFTVAGKQASRFTLDGLVVTGRGLQVRGPERGDPDAVAQGDLCDVTIRHCTLVPGWGLESDCGPKRPNEPSLELTNTTAKTVIEHSIVGSIYVSADEVQTDPVEISISDSIVDATSIDRVAIGAPSLPLAFARLAILRTTVIGAVDTHAIVLAENAIFMGPVRVGRRQLGCVRFCYLTPGSRTPRRYHCQPDLVIAGVDDLKPPLTADEKSTLKDRETQRVQPRFISTRYGTPAYGRLADDCAEEIRGGADDESEMGAFHDVFQPQRTANLRARLDEYTPAGLEAGILFAN